MENSDNKNFTCSYSDKEREELKQIRSRYETERKAPDSRESKMERLRALDKGVTKKGTAASVIIGIVGALLLGVGMCCTMVWAESQFVTGIVVGLVGIGVVALAYPTYNQITKLQRKKIAPEIKSLTDELMD